MVDTKQKLSADEAAALKHYLSDIYRAYVDNLDKNDPVAMRMALREAHKTQLEFLQAGDMDIQDIASKSGQVDFKMLNGKNLEELAEYIGNNFTELAGPIEAEVANAKVRGLDEFVEKPGQVLSTAERQILGAFAQDLYFASKSANGLTHANYTNSLLEVSKAYEYTASAKGMDLQDILAKVDGLDWRNAVRNPEDFLDSIGKHYPNIDERMASRALSHVGGLNGESRQDVPSPSTSARSRDI